MLDRILELPAKVKKKYNLSSMRSLICAAAPATPELKKAANAFFKERGCKENVFLEYYGSAETAVTTVLIPEDYEREPKRYASVGKPRCGITRIYNEDKGEWCSVDEEGTLLTQTFMTVSLRYAGTPEKLEDAYQEVDGVSWFDDGLLGYMDEDDFLYLTGRKKEMVICGGVNVYPNEIEPVIKKHPKVFDVAVVRAPDPDLGEIPAAVIQLQKGKKSTKKEIIDYCRKNGLYGYKIPKIIKFTQELPRHIDGKLIKREIEDKYWKTTERRG